MDLALYDLDGTLTRRATYTPFLIFAAGRKAPWRRALLPVWIGAMLVYKLGLITRGDLKTFGLRLFVPSRDLQTLGELGEAFADGLAAQGGFNPALLAQLEADRKAGRTVVIATAAFAFYATPIARHLGVEEVIGTRWNGRRIDGGNCYGAEKLRRVENWLEGRGLSLSAGRTRMLTDSFADRPLMAKVDEAVFVTSRASVRRRAEKLGWQAIHPVTG